MSNVEQTLRGKMIHPGKWVLTKPFESYSCRKVYKVFHV